MSTPLQKLAIQQIQPRRQTKFSPLQRQILTVFMEHPDTIVSMEMIMTAIWGEATPEAVATGDDASNGDEDGIVFDATTWTPGDGGYLMGWIDLNSDGDFDDPGEQIVAQAVVDGSNAITFDIDAGTAGSNTILNMRFRLFEREADADALVSQYGAAYMSGVSNGEVEDYQTILTTTLPVTLAYFYAERQGGEVIFTW